MKFKTIIHTKATLVYMSLKSEKQIVSVFSCVRIHAGLCALCILTYERTIISFFRTIPVTLSHVISHTFKHGRRQKFFQGGANHHFCHKPSVNCKIFEENGKRRTYCQQKVSKRAKMTLRNSRIVAVLAV